MSQIKVLIVDDDLSQFERLRGYCAGKAPDVTVLSAISGPRALAIAASQQPDVIAVDASIPDMDGYELAEKIHATPGLELVPIVMLAPVLDEVAETRAEEVHAISQIEASVDPSSMLATLRDAVLVKGSAAVGGGGSGSSGVEHTVDDLLRILLDRDGSDLHLTVGSPPGLRIRGELLPLEGTKPLTPKDTQDLILALLSEEQRRRFDAELELDFAYSIPGLSRFRANVFQQRNSMGAVFRTIPLAIPTIAELNLPKVCQYLSERPRGLVLVTGPTGSGKSTTLYTTLELIKSPERKVYTVEDPVERKISGIVQTEVKPAIGLTFAQVLRSLVRADPDVIMVGEIRDLETAKMAADAAVTGHQVFSTLHTNDASSAVNRLIEMGVPRYLVAAAWRCFVAQRLVRRLCPHCRTAETLSDARWLELGLGPAPRKRMRVYNPVGCAKCFGTGYRGRVGVYEVLVVDDQLRDLIATGGTVLEIQRLARSHGVESLRDDGVRKVLEGTTSHLELLRVTV